MTATNVFIIDVPCRTTTTTAPTSPTTNLPPPETPTDTTPVPEEYEDFFVGSSSSSEPSPTARKEIDTGSVVYEDEYGNPIYVDESGEVYYSSAEGSGEVGGAYDDYGYYGEYGHPGTTVGPLDTVGDEGEVFYGTESGPRRDQQGRNSMELRLL